MAEIIDMEKPEGLEPGDLIDRIGTCPYCGQRHFVKAHPEDPETELAELAIEVCECGRAEEEKGIRQAVASMEMQLMERYRYMRKDVRDAILAVLRPVAAGNLKKAAFTAGDGSTTYTVFRKEGKLRFLRSHTEQEEVSE